MYIEKLKLVNYRNYEKLDVTFSNTLNILFGPNGAGKSNVIEAIYLLSLTKSFRTNNEENLIMKEKSSSFIKGTIINKEKTSYQIDLNKDGKKVYIDNDKIAKISDYVSRIPIIIFNPLDTKIINDSPAFRRKMLNIEISQINKEYLLLLASYNKILKNRNAYLKQLYINGNASSDYLDILTDKLIKIGLDINHIRSEYLEKINDNISKIYKNIFEYGDLKVKYISSFNKKDEKGILESYKKNYAKEMAFGKTANGVHHDDIDFILDGHSIKEYGSVGQQKNAIIAFKLSELMIIKELKGEYPILILDDLFSELDENKVNNIIKMLNKEVQTFITTTDVDKVNKKLLEGSNLYRINQGIMERIDK